MSWTPQGTPKADRQSGDYVRLRRIGAGSYGDVWLAHDAVGKRLALKTIDRERLRQVSSTNREERALRLLRTQLPEHPHLIRIFHVGNDGACLYYTMELADDAEGAPPWSTNRDHYRPRTLAELTSQREIVSVPDAIAIVRDLLRAVGCLHDHGIVHRDIKPTNILSVGGVWKLADIGLMAEESTQMTTVGTPDFMPPTGKIDRGADLYALGKVLYCLVTGNTPRSFPSIPAARLTPDRRHQMAAVNDVIAQACDNRPELRFETAAAFDLALQRCGARMQTPPVRRRLAPAALAFAFGLAGMVGLWTWDSRVATLPPSVSIPVGASPRYLGLGDMNADGRIDLVVANAFGSDVSVLLLQSNGRLAAPVRHRVGYEPRSVALADFNRDGMLDIATSNWKQDHISVLLSNRRSGYEALPTVKVGDEPLNIVAGDLNADGAADLVVTNGKDGDVSILLNDGIGQFAAQQRVSTGTRPLGICLADFDRDDALDIAVGNWADGTLSILRRGVAGEFELSEMIDVGRSPFAVTAGDTNGDQRPDLVVANEHDNHVSLFVNDAAGGFLPPQRLVVGQLPWSVALGDLNGDGLVDLAVANHLGNDISMLINEGGGRFKPQRRLAAGDRPASLTIGEFGGGRAADIVVANRDSDDITILRNPYWRWQEQGEQNTDAVAGEGSVPNRE